MVVVVCDVCCLPPPGEYWHMRVGDGPVFTVCEGCADRPFRVPPARSATVVLAPGAGKITVVSQDPLP